MNLINKNSLTKVQPYNQVEQNNRCTFISDNELHVIRIIYIYYLDYYRRHILF